MVAPEVVEPFGLAFMKNNPLLHFFGNIDPKPHRERLGFPEDADLAQVQPGIAVEFQALPLMARRPLFPFFAGSRLV